MALASGARCLVLAAVVLAAIPVRGAPVGVDNPHVVEGEARRRSFERALATMGASKDAGGWAPVLGPSPIDVLHYDLDLFLDFELEIATGSAELTIEAVVDGLEEVGLDCDRGLRVLGARMVGDGSFPYDSGVGLGLEHSGDRLLIRLPRAFAAGERLTLLIAYGGHASRGDQGLLWESHGPSEAPLLHSDAEPFGARLWFPCNDRPDDKATVSLRVTAPAELSVAGNGLLVDRRTNPDGTATTSWSSQYQIATYLVVLNVSDFVASETTYVGRDGTTMPVELYAYPELAGVEDQFAPTTSMLELLAASFGEYPFIDEKYGNCITPRLGAMENQTLTSMSERELGRPLLDTFNVHEAAHQWWGDWVTNGDWRDLWLNEGFATYAELLWAEHLGPDQLAAALDLISVLGFHAGPVYDNPVPFASAVYEKGAWILRMLENQLGRDELFAALARYRQESAGGNGSSERLEQILEDQSGVELDRFFDQWLHGLNAPRLHWSWSEVPGPAVRLVVAQKQTNAALFELPIDVLVSGAGFSVSDTLRLEALASQTFEIPVPAPPLSVTVDPDRYLYAELSEASAPDLDLGPGFPGPYRAPVGLFNVQTTVTLPMSNLGGSDLVVSDVRPMTAVTTEVVAPELPAVIPPGATTDLVVGITPGVTTEYTALFSIESNDPGGATMVVVNGAGAVFGTPYLRAPNRLRFGDVAVGGSGEGVVLLENLGAADLVLEAEIAGDGWTLGAAAPARIVPGGSVELPVQLTPVAVGPASGTLTVSSNAPGGSHLVELSGAGVAAPRLQVTPAEVLLGLGSSRRESTVVIANSGSSDLEVASVTVSEPFAIDGPGCPCSLAPDERLAVQVTVAAPEGLVRGALQILSDDPALPLARIAVRALVSDEPSARWFVPAAASSDGLGGARWTTDAVILNPGPTARALDLRVLTRSGMSAAPELCLWLPPSGQRTVTDVVAAAGHSGAGGLELVADARGPIAVTRTFAAADHGTFGQLVPAVGDSGLIGAGEIRVLTPLASGGFHSNVGIVNLGGVAVAATVELHDRDGQLLGRFDLAAAPGAHAQRTAVLAAVTTREIRGGFATITSSSPGASYAAYASVVDDGSHDATFVAPAEIAAGPLAAVVPVVASKPGDLGTRWRSEVAVVNTGGGEAGLSVRFHPAAGGQELRREVTIPASAGFWEADVVAWLGGRGAGWLELVSDSPGLVSASRISNDQPSGTYGQYVPVGGSPATTEQTLVIPGVRSGADFRTNLGVTAVDGGEVGLDVAVFDEHGGEVGALRVTVPAHGFTQVHRLGERVGLVGSGWVRLQCATPGAAVIAHASVVDNTTGDPTYVPAVVVEGGR